MNTCNFTKAPLRGYYADLWRNIAEAILGCVFSHWGLKVYKPKIISDLFIVTAFIFWTFLTLFLSLVCIQHPLPCPCPWAKSQHHNTYKCCQVTPNNILAAIMPSICSNPAAAKLHYRQYTHGHVSPLTWRYRHLHTIRLWADSYTSYVWWRLPHYFGTINLIKEGIIRLRNDGNTWPNSILQSFKIQQVCCKLFSALLFLQAVYFLKCHRPTYFCSSLPYPLYQLQLHLCVRKKTHCYLLNVF